MSQLLGLKWVKLLQSSFNRLKALRWLAVTGNTSLRVPIVPTVACRIECKAGVARIAAERPQFYVVINPAFTLLLC